MGQGQSRSTNQLQVRIEHPPAGHPTKGLAFIAHGRLGGNYDQPQIRCLADYLRNQKLCRVVTWNERDAEWWDAGAWVGDAAIQDYKVGVSVTPRLASHAQSNCITHICTAV
jgi:hypothetical protein